ncbi:MAG: ABC transporter permease [Actinomycetota bacterium]
MQLIWQGFLEAFGLLFSFNKDIVEIVSMTLKVTGTAALIAMVIGLPVGAFMGLTRFKGRQFFVTLTNTGMALPPVVVGLFVYLLISRYGPLGTLDILYTPSAMILAEVIIATPMVIGVTLAAVQALDQRLISQIYSLGASNVQLFFKIVREARLGLLASVAAGFGAIISEVGAVMMVGGNIKDSTRVLTTAIVMETRQGHTSMAIALSIILLTLAFVVNGFITYAQQRKR